MEKNCETNGKNSNTLGLVLLYMVYKKVQSKVKIKFKKGKHTQLQAMYGLKALATNQLSNNGLYVKF